jgi:hypothetical protein
MPPNANLDSAHQPSRKLQVTDDKKTKGNLAPSDSGEFAASIREAKHDHPGDDEDSARDVDEKVVKP